MSSRRLVSVGIQNTIWYTVVLNFTPNFDNRSRTSRHDGKNLDGVTESILDWNLIEAAFSDVVVVDTNQSRKDMCKTSILSQNPLEGH